MVRAQFFFVVLLAAIITGCSDKNDNSNPLGPTESSSLAVVCTSGTDESNISVVDYVNNKAYIDLLPVNGISELTQYNGDVYIIDTNGDRIIKFDPANRTAVSEMSTGAKSAPEDIAFLSAKKAYVTLTEDPHVLIIDPSGMTVTGSIDLSSMADNDGNPDQGNAVIKNGKLYVSLRRNNGRAMTDHSSVAVIDIVKDTVIGEIVLKTNGVGGSAKHPLGGGVNGASILQGNVYAACIGTVTSGTDGAVEVVNGDTMSTEVLLSETEIGGSILYWVFETSTTGWAMVGLSTTSGGDGWGLKRFDLTARTFTAVSSFQKSTLCWALDFSSDGLVLTGSQDENNPGVWVFDSKKDYKPVFDKPINVGLLAKRILVVD
ncbi:hypothetical protein LLG96_20435 [bacterium]|nr:hypothetical protein [bacterium]